MEMSPDPMVAGSTATLSEKVTVNCLGEAAGDVIFGAAALAVAAWCLD